MRGLDRLLKLLVLFGAFGLSTYFALQFRSGGLWSGIEVAHAVSRARGTGPKEPYDLTRLEAVTATVQHIRDKYVDPARVKPRDMLLSALNFVQRDVAQVIVLRDEGAGEVTVRVGSAEKKFRVDNVQGPWDVSAHLREVFTFLQEHLRSSPEVDLREVEYAACNGMLHTLDPHSIFLSPEAYREMSISTQGAFGGVGIVISIRDQMLTIIKPMPGTPAGRAGLKRHDRILKINNESTLNMPLDDAVRRLRGDPATTVVVHVRRDGAGGWQGTRPFELKREIINVESIESRLLDGGVGYVRVKQFQASTASELDNALAALHRADPKMRGLLLDMRSNPGGLLDQAAKVADRFLEAGTIVTTVSASEPRDEKVAKGPGTEPPYPLVVLVNAQSASASEIVAGALKNLNRAVIVGERTFGKGSVQLVFPEVTRDKAALKLTIAQYLTPGDTSIQSVGITPDVELDAMTVDSVEMDVMLTGKGTREGDLSKHLSNVRARDGQKPLASLRYSLPRDDREALRERGGDPDDNFELDFPVRFGKDLVLHMPPAAPRAEAVRAAGEFIQSVEREEVVKAAAELAKLGCDWTEPPSATAPGPDPKDFEVKAETDRPGNEVTAGGTMSVRATVKNNAKTPVWRLRAVTKSDNPYFDNKELIFGKIEPGKAKTAAAPLGWCDVEGRKIGSTAAIPKGAKRVCTIPKEAPTRADRVTLRFDAPGEHAPPPIELQTTIRELPRPAFAYAFQFADNGPGSNGDGRLQRGEGVSVYLTVKNVGKGHSFETQANIRNLSGDGVLLQAGRFDISNMNPGDVRSVAFTFQTQPQLANGEAKLDLIVGDRDLGEYASEKVKFAVEPALAIVEERAALKAGPQGAMLLEAPQAGARSFGRLAPGTVVNKLGRAGDIVKVDLGNRRFAFAPAAQLVDAAGATPSDVVAFETSFAHAPPAIDLKAEALAVRGGKVKVTAVVTDAASLLDGYMFVGSRKIFFQSQQGAADPKTMRVELDASVRPGMNAITFIARHSADTTARRVVIVRRDGPSGELLPTPKDADNELGASSPWQQSE
jgi:carboxyl-terminal processing protease